MKLGARTGTSALVLGVAMATAAGAAHAGPPARPAVKVGQPVLVTGNTPFPADCSAGNKEHVGSETEVSLAVHPHDPDVLAATWMQDANIAHPVARSTDGGESWETEVVSGMSPCTGSETVAGVFDPWLSYGADGSLYLSSLSGAEKSHAGDLIDQWDPFSRHVYVNVSLDKGQTWSQPPVAAGGDVDNGFVLDKATLTADPTRSQHAFATWSRIQLVAGAPLLGFARTTDGGRSWQQSDLPLPAVSDHAALGGQAISEVEVLPNGDLLLIAGDVLPQPLVAPIVLPFSLLGSDPPISPFVGPMRYQALRSTDAGQSWEPTSSYIGEGRSVPEPPATAVAPDGTVYVAWVDRGDHDSSVVVARSTDGGRSWSRTTVVASERRASVPGLAVDAEGVVALTWYQPVDDRVQPWVALSHDGSASWVEAPQTEPFSMAGVPERNSAGGNQLGDYTGLVGLRKGFVSVISLAGDLAQHGPTDLVAVRISSKPER